MSTSGPDPPQQTAFLTSASSSLATIRSIGNGSSSAPPLPASTTSPTSSPIVTGFRLGGKIGLGVGIAAVFAIFFCWFLPKRHRSKKKPEISPFPTIPDTLDATLDIKQTSVTTEVKKPDERHLSARVKTM